MRLGGAYLLGLGVTAAALAFGSRSLGVVGVGLLLAATAARIWAGLARGRVSVSFSATPAPAVEGDRVVLRIAAERSSGVPVGSIVASGVLGRLGPFETRLRGHRRHARGELWLGALPRGRYVVSDAVLALGDHLGFESLTTRVETGGFALVVQPRLVDVGLLFSDAGRVGGYGRRLLLRRPAGFDLHSVREYTQGESLRRVHWPTTARTGQLMVKELEDSPRDAAAVLLDCDPAGCVGASTDTSFDAAVRAAGSVVRHYAQRSRRAILVTTGRSCVVQPVTSLDSDFPAALAELSAADPDALCSLPSWLRQGRLREAPAGELVVVTSNLDPAAVDAIHAASLGRLVSVVWIDAPTYVDRPTAAASGPLRLMRLGIPVAVVRRGEPLTDALDLAATETRSYG